jgi:hypothetical protein
MFCLFAECLDPEFLALSKEAEFFKCNAFASTTKSTYRCQLNAFLRFCFYFGRPHLPVGQDTLRCYVAYLSRSLNPNSIPGYLNIFRILHVNSGLPNPLLDNWEIAMIRRGITRKFGCPPKQKLPVTIEILYELLDIDLPFDCAF